MDTSISSYIDSIQNSIDYLSLHIENNINSVVSDELLYVNDLISSIETNVNKKIENTTYSVNILLNTLDKLNPIRLLRQGYAVIDKDNEPIDSSNLAVHDMIDIHTYDSKIRAEILAIEKEKKENVRAKH